jgi:hypothetical protein
LGACSFEKIALLQANANLGLSMKISQKGHLIAAMSIHEQSSKEHKR